MKTTKILLSVSKEQLSIKREDIFALCKAYLPGAYVEIDERAQTLLVETETDLDPVFAADQLIGRLFEIGVAASRISQTQQNHGGEYAGWQTGPVPPIKMKFKQPKTVKMSVFVISMIAAVLLVAILAFNIGALFGSPFSSEKTLGTGEQEGENYAEKIALIDYIFEEYGLYDTDGKLLLDEMLRAYAAATGDKYAAYYTAEELAAMMSDMNGNAVGIGVTVTMDPASGCILVIQVAPDSPADKAGIEVGDLIVKIGTKAEGELVGDIGYELAMRKLVGEAGTTANIVLLRGSEELEFSIVRAAFHTISVSGFVSTTDKSVGIVRISGFDTGTPTQFKNVMGTLIAGGCDRFVFDVRNNPGGEQKSVMAVLSYFLQENDVIMSTVKKDGTTTYFRAEAATYSGDYAACSVKKEEIGMYRGYGAVVLTNGYTASAGELFTAALAESGVATVVGETTYGKGVFQTIYDLSSMGYSGGIKLTIGYYAPPSGVNYDGKGIEPGVPVEPNEAVLTQNLYLLSESEDNQLAAAIAELLK